jgi:hypothetical protein
MEYGSSLYDLLSHSDHIVTIYIIKINGEVR